MCLSSLHNSHTKHIIIVVVVVVAVVFADLTSTIMVQVLLLRPPSSGLLL